MFQNKYDGCFLSFGIIDQILSYVLSFCFELHEF